MTGYLQNIEDATTENNNFRQVLYTGQHSQLVIMSLLPQEEIGSEVHHDTDQFFRVEEGEGTLVINGEKFAFNEDDAFIVPAGAEHNVINTSQTETLKLYTIYSPPNHPTGTIHATKADADAAEAAGHH
ncbi:MAG TPA: cupin domain-containing protein [Candidatus Woesebacteria bacterium]|nr:cupin domain-containing protein [Candidatus Woesebacteria bacterium]